MTSMGQETIVKVITHIFLIKKRKLVYSLEPKLFKL